MQYGQGRAWARGGGEGRNPNRMAAEEKGGEDTASETRDRGRKEEEQSAEGQGFHCSPQAPGNRTTFEGWRERTAEGRQAENATGRVLTDKMRSQRKSEEGDTGAKFSFQEVFPLLETGKEESGLRIQGSHGRAGIRRGGVGRKLRGGGGNMCTHRADLHCTAETNSTVKQ